MVIRAGRISIVAGAGLLLGGLAVATPWSVSAAPAPASTAAPAVAAIAPQDSAALSKVGHVFVIMLENKSFTETFGPQGSTDSADDYLRTVAPSQGALLKEYYGTSHFSHSNYVTLTSGQPPNAYNQTDCMYYREFEQTSIDKDGIAHGVGCVFPKAVKSVGDQLTGAKKTWRAYAESMDAYNGPGYTSGPGCRRPKANGYDATYSDEYNYAARHVPFLYFHSITDKSTCKDLVVDSGKLSGDLAKVATTPNLSFIVPNTCNDGHESTCVDGSTGGVTGINNYLKTAVPMITNSPAFKQDGLLLILFDEAEFNGPDEASSTCCNAPLGPNSPNKGAVVPGEGGGRTGAVAISPFIKPGTTTDSPYNHYSTLRTIEDIFGLSHLGYAAQSDVHPMGADVFTQP